MADLVLVLEASAGSGSLALLRGDVVVAERRVPMRGHDGERMMPALVAMLHDGGASTADLARIVCGGGPGGFTSLRIAAAIAKGLACSLGVELWAASSLALLAAGVDDRSREVLAVLDALRGEWYVQRFGWDAHGAVAAQSPPMRLGREEILAAAASHRAQVVGGGAGAFPGGRETLPEARHVVGLAPGTLLQAVDLAAWEPEYGRLAEAQVKWEQAHGRALGLAG